MSEEQFNAPPRKKPEKKLLILLGAVTGALLLVIAAVLITIAAVNPGILAFGGAPKPVAEMTDAERGAYAEEIKARIAKHMLLPAETPQITAAEENLSELLAQGGFWRDLERGDLILVFTQEARVVIWRPSRNLVVNVGPILNTNGAAQ